MKRRRKVRGTKMTTPELVAELKQKMVTERAALIAAAEGLTADDSLRVPVDAKGEEQWTALEQLSHLWEMERGYVAWVQAACEADNPDISGVQGEPIDIPIERANETGVSDLLAALAAERTKTLALIDVLALEEFDRTATSPMFGTLTVLQWLRSFYRHDRQHAAQIEGRRSDYKPNFKGSEPNQRKMRLERMARSSD
jgi:hypothetical protein